MSTEGIQLRRTRTPSQRLWANLIELLSSMRFAVAILAVICIASVIGTVITQNEPQINYINQFGPFWAQVFMRCQLNTVYSSWWFLLLLAFLVISTSLCIARNTPKILRHLHDHKENLRAASFAAFSPKHRAQGSFTGQAAQHAQVLGEVLLARHWRVKRQTRADGIMLAAKSGHWNKLGYIATHSAIVLICVGGLLDGDLLIKAQQWLGQKSVYQGVGYIANIAPEHRLGADNPSYRVNLRVSEGSANSAAILNQSQGVLIQDLPFSVELKKFFVEYYSTGAPKVFASDIVIHDKTTGQSTPARVEVNKPFQYQGNSIYQSSFEDGGSLLQLQPLVLDAKVQAQPTEGRVGESIAVQFGTQTEQLELGDLRTINVENFSQVGKEANASTGSSSTDVRKVDLQSSLNQHFGAANKEKKNPNLHNVGPKVQYKLRDAAGQAVEFDNYMLPVQMPGQSMPHFLFGMRTSPSDAFRYLRVPMDSEGGAEEFARLRRALQNPAALQAAAAAYAQQSVAAEAGGSPAAHRALVAQLENATLTTLQRFSGAQAEPATPGDAKAGLPAIAYHIESRIPEAQRAMASDYVMRMLTGSIWQLLQQTRQQAGLQALADVPAARDYTVQQISAINDSFAWPAPVIYTLKNFQQVQASVFQITKGPGKYVVYLGCILLILGVMAMLYIREQRLWIWLSHRGQMQIAYSSNRPGLDSDRAFAQIRDALLAPQAQ
jgi:cytochrome c biogenesis protein